MSEHDIHGKKVTMLEMIDRVHLLENQLADAREQAAQANAAAGEAKAAYSAEIKSHARTEQQRISLLRENEQLKARESLHREYEQLLGDEINEICSLGYVHGWRSTRYEQGKQLREKLGIEEAK